MKTNESKSKLVFKKEVISNLDKIIGGGNGKEPTCWGWNPNWSGTVGGYWYYTGNSCITAPTQQPNACIL